MVIIVTIYNWETMQPTTKGTVAFPVNIRFGEARITLNLQQTFPRSGETRYSLSHAGIVIRSIHCWRPGSPSPANIAVSACKYSVIYTTTDWWTQCIGDSAALAGLSSLESSLFVQQTRTGPNRHCNTNAIRSAASETTRLT